MQEVLTCELWPFPNFLLSTLILSKLVLFEWALAAPRLVEVYPKYRRWSPNLSSNNTGNKKHRFLCDMCQAIGYLIKQTQ